MIIETPKSVITRKRLFTTLIFAAAVIAFSIFTQGYESLNAIGIIIILSVTCLGSVIVYLTTSRNYISSIELNESNVIIENSKNLQQTLNWSDINAMDLSKIATQNKYIPLPGYLFRNRDQNEEYLNFINRKLYEESINCMKCGSVIPEGSKNCENCGWSYLN